MSKNFQKLLSKYLFFVKLSILSYQRSSILGIFWTLILPIINGFILVAIFTSIFHMPVAESLFYLWPALFLWHYFVATTSNLCTSLNSSNVKTSSNHNILFPLTALFNFFPSFILICTLLVTLKILLFKKIPFLFILNIIPSFSIFILFTLGIGLLLSLLYVFFRDINHIWGVICQIVFFTCPILFPESFLYKSKFWFILKLNPMFYFIKLFREPISTYSLAPLRIWLICLTIALITCFLGVFTFNKMNRKFIHFL